MLDELDLEDYDLILMDIQMPVLNGIDATRAVRNHPLHKDIPIIAVSGFAFEENIEEMKAAGVNDFIAKPVRKDELIGAINKVIILHSEALALYV